MKHFAGFSESISGHDRVEAQLSLRYLQDTFLTLVCGRDRRRRGDRDGEFRVGQRRARDRVRFLLYRAAQPASASRV